MTALFVLANEYRQDLAKLEDLELDEQALADTLESLGGDLQVKASNVAMFARNLEATADAIREAEGAMAKRRKALEARVDGLKRYIKTCMEVAQVQKIECPYFAMTIKKTPPSVDVFELGLLPAEFMRQPPPPAAAPDKVAIGAALKAGFDVQGARLVSGTRLEIK